MSNFGQTSLITILSSEHGRLRREQRDIDKRDLQKALKYGTCSRTWGNRWKIEYDGIIFITDNSMKREITAFPSPLANAPVIQDDIDSHEKAKAVITSKPDLSVTHTVLVMDKSGSMLTHDINLHRDRHTAAYSTTAMELVAEQLFSGTANNRDLVSLIEFDNTAKVIFSSEPLTWVLYNKLLNRQDMSRFESRRQKKGMDMNGFGMDMSNYLPALDRAEEMLETGNHEDCALSLLFLSDGKPTDFSKQGFTPVATNRRLCERVNDIAMQFGEQLTVTLIGFGNSYSDFSTLESMAEKINESESGATAQYMYCDKYAHSIGNAISSMVTSLTQTRTALLSSSRQRMCHTKRSIETEGSSSLSRAASWKKHRILDHFLYNPHTREFQQFGGIPPGAINNSDDKSLAEVRAENPPLYLLVSTKACGTGVERVAFRSTLSDDGKSHIFGTMVAKETNLVERIRENAAFHKKFLETQSLASYLAEEFNKRLRGLPNYDPRTTPLIEFLPCSVLLIEDRNWPGGTRGVLVEKMLDLERLSWVKWNNNSGAVDGKLFHKPLNVEREFAKLGISEGIIEEGSEEDYSDDDEEDENTFFDQLQQPADNHASSGPTPSEYLQAFSHFTYRFTNRKLIVVDLQGTYDADATPPKFHLTDPAIHYKSSQGEEMVYGRTDKGKKGIQLFFNTHKCSELCEYLKLCKAKKDWRKDYEKEFTDSCYTDIGDLSLLDVSL